MKLHTFGFCLQEATRNLRRNPVLAVASITTTAVSLLVLAIFLLLSENVVHVTQVVENQVAVRAFITQSVTPAQEQAMMQQVKGWTGVDKVLFISRAQALQQLKQEFGKQAKLLDGLGSANPLEDSFSVTAANTKAVPQIAQKLDALPGIDHVSYQSQVVTRLFNLLGGVRLIGLAIGVLLLFGALLVIHNAIRLGIVARRRDIAIMRLVGATESLVHWPFIVEGLALGFTGAVVAGALAWWGYSWLFVKAAITIPWLPLVVPQPLLWHVAVLIAFLGTMVGVVAFRLSVRRMAKV